MGGSWAGQYCQDVWAGGNLKVFSLVWFSHFTGEKSEVHGGWKNYGIQYLFKIGEGNATQLSIFPLFSPLKKNPEINVHLNF